MSKFDIIITSWNRLEYLKRTVGSLIQTGALKDAQQVIIVDNGSTQEGLYDFLYQLQKDYGVFLVLRPCNNGWGRSINDAIGLSRAEYVLVSNNDVEYNTPDFHKQMIEIIETHPMVGILGVWRHTAHGMVAEGLHTEWFDEMDNVPAVGWMMSKKSMQVVGMFPEHGVCLTKGGNGEDTSYVNRMKSAGFLVGVPTKDLATHIDGY